MEPDSSKDPTNSGNSRYQQHDSVATLITSIPEFTACIMLQIYAHLFWTILEKKQLLDHDGLVDVV